MKVSEFPELREYRDELARKIQKKCGGGGYLDAVDEANKTCRRIYEMATRAAGGRDPGREAVSSMVREVRRTVGVTEMTAAAPKPQPKKPKDAALSEVVRQAVARVLTETLGHTAPAAAAADSRPLHEISNDELADRLAEMYSAAAQAGPAYAAALAQVRETAPTEDNAPSGAELRAMSDDEFMSHLGAAQIEHGDRLRPPAGVSPLWAAQ